MKYLFFILLIMTELTAFSQNQYESDWKKTDSLMGLGQSKTALEIVNRIYAETKQQLNNPQFLKASIYKMSIKSTYEEDNLAKSIEEIKADLKTATFPVNSVLHSILAELYWQFYQNNRYQFLNRTELEGDTSTDILTWSARRLADECVIHYNASLENSDQLKSVNVNSIDAILRQGYITRNLRPSLFDFLAHRAIDFYINTETGLTRPADIFTIDNPEYFALSDKFSTLEIQSSYQASFDYNALKLFQSVVVFHLTDKDPSALVDLEIKRLNFIHNSSILPEKDSLMMQALKLLEKKYADYPCYTEIAYRRALLLTETAVKYKPLVSDDHKWDFREARQLAQSAADKYPDSYDAKSCQALVNSISYPTLDINQEFASSPGKPALALVSSKNIDKIFIRLIKTTPQNDREIMENSNGRPNDIYCKMKPDREWIQELPTDGDFQPHACEIAIPALEQGYYIMLSSNNSNFPVDSTLCINKLWRTNISYISRRNDDGSYSLFLTGREDGQPLKKVKIQSFFREYDYNSRKYNEKPGVELFTDKDGFATVPSRNRDRENQYYLQFTYGKEQFMTENYFYGYSYKYDGLNKVISTSLFTDRAIYRPGQTVFFKGIVTEREEKEVRIVPAYKSTITFFDVNGQKLSSLELTTNDYGSFSGSFTIPSGTLTGSMNLQSVNGAISILVEEYKRPKFEVRFNPVKGAYKLGEQLNVTGKAVAYAGNNISDAQVKYRVVRTANFPYRWWGWFYWLPDSPEMEIVHGTTISDQKGEFKISFLAAPDLSLDRKWNPVFSYRVIAEVTDINGETHESETTVSVGYKSLLVNLGIPENVDLGELKPYSLSTTNLNGEKEVAKGELKIWKLKNPDIVFKSRLWNQPDRFVAGQGQFRKQFPNDIYSNEDDFSSWTKETLAYSSAFNTATDSTVLLKGLNPGRYKYEIITTDTFGEKIEISGSFLAFSKSSRTVPANQVSWFTILNNIVEPGDTAEILVGTATSNVKAVFEVFQNDKVISKELISLNKEQRLMRIPIKEEYRGNISVNLVFIQMNRSYQNSGVIQVPWTNKKLDIEIASFRSKLTPGQEEEWKITVRGSKGEKLAAELLAGMYDASLDAFASHEWNFSLFNSINRQLPWEISSAFGSRGSSNYTFPYNYYSRNTRLYDELNWFGLNFHYRVMYSKGLGMASSVNEEKSALISREMPAMVSDEAMLDKTPVAKEQVPVPPSESKKQTDPGVSKIRTDFKETAFFYPQMSTDENGSLVLHFTIPESLTKWRMMGLAYTKDLKIGQIEKSLVTQKDLMVFPNLPRFFREGDHMVFSTKVSSLINSSMKGSATLHFFNAYTMQPIDSLILTEPATKDFSIEASSSAVVNWKIIIPEGIEAITYRITASGNTMSDGEEGVIPVLSNRILVTESMPLPVNGNQSKSFSFKKLLDSGKGSNTLRNYRLSLEYTSNPAWYAVQALPYLMEYPYECAEQVFSRYYANSLATFIANSDPKIKAVFESWKKLTPSAFQSNLEKNQELKSILLEESPWVREANNETERKQRIALLFDLNKMESEQSSAIKKLIDLQAPNGGWPWFTGMPDNRYITQHVVTGLGHLEHLGVARYKDDSKYMAMLNSALSYLDARLTEDFEKMKQQDPKYKENCHLGYTEIQYLYARSYFMKEFPVNKQAKEAFDYYKSQAMQYWNTQNNYLKGMTALALSRFGESKTAALVLRSVKETSLHNEEMGMYWRNENHAWFWYQAPIETQALLIEAFDEVLNDTKSVDEMKIWLLKQKQTQDWKTTKATTEAIYALLLRGTDLLGSDKMVSISLGNEAIDPRQMDEASRPEAGTGYFKTSWSGTDIKPSMGKIKITNPNSTVAWGAMYWQYFEQMDKITSSETPLKLSKKLFRETIGATGPVLEPISESTPLKVGDKVVVRVELRSDRDMEYLHLKDMRASSFEPTEVLSGYKWQDGLGYYCSMRDASANFFISYLPKGTYVFEYRLFATQKGEFSNGITSIQCMYAPEFNAHSEGVKVIVQ